MFGRKKQVAPAVVTLPPFDVVDVLRKQVQRRALYDFDAVDLFSGVGWDAQARELGLIVVGIDNDKDVVSLRANHQMPTLKADLWTMRPADFGFRFEGLIGSPSCKRWSPAGKGEARGELDRILAAVPAVRDGKAVNAVLADVSPEAALVLAPLEWAVYHQPEWIALEQVSQVQPVWDAIAQALRHIGYSAETGIVYSEQYGTPQHRRRSILVANREKVVSLPTPTHSRYYPANPVKLDPGVEKWVTMADGLGWDTDNAADDYPKAMRSNYGTHGDPKDRGMRSTDEPAATVTTKGSRSLWVYGSEEPAPEWVSERPATTVVASFRPDIIAAPGYRKAGDGPRQNAAGSVQVTVEETAKLQGFPEWLDWDALGKTAAHRLIGNAVPGQLAKATINAARGIR